MPVPFMPVSTGRDQDRL